MAEYDGSVASASGGRIRAVVVAFLVAVAGFVLGIGTIFTLSVVAALAKIRAGPVEQLFLSLVGLQGIAFPAAAYLYLRWRGLPLSFVPARVPSGRELLVVFGGYIGVFALVLVTGTVVTVLVSALAGTEPAPNQAGMTALENPEIIPWLIPAMLFVLGPGEELLFRGIIQGSLREKFSAPAAIVLAGLTFAPAHIPALVGSPAAVLATVTILFVPSLVFGAVYEYTDNIVVPALLHGLYNSTLLALLYAAVQSGAVPT